MEYNVMSVSNVGASTNAYAYLQSLLPAQTANGSQGAGAADPVSELLDAFYPNGAPGQSGAPAASGAAGAAATPASAMAGPPFSPDTMSALMSAQEHQPGNPSVAAHAQNLFSQFDADGDGQVSKPEFENVFGPGADMSKVDGLFNALDGNGDGSMSLDELNSAAQAGHARHHGHHHHVDSGQGGGEGGMLQALLSSGTQGASADTASNTDGSSTTTITYADGSKVSLTSPPGSSGTNSSSTPSGSGNDANYLERLIRLQAQSLTVSTSQTLASV
jgi:hypothetical protein